MNFCIYFYWMTHIFTSLWTEDELKDTLSLCKSQIWQIYATDLCYNDGMKPTVTIPTSPTLDALRAKHGLTLILLHGSQVGTFHHPESDVDVAVLRDKTKPHFRYLYLVNDLIDVFDTDQIDLVDLTHADPLLLFATTKNCQLLSGNEADLVNLQRLAFHRYNDYLGYLKEEQNFIRKKLQTYVTS